MTNWNAAVDKYMQVCTVSLYQHHFISLCSCLAQSIDYDCQWCGHYDIYMTGVFYEATRMEGLHLERNLGLNGSESGRF